MSWRRYFPSAQFSLISVSLLCSIALVFLADLVTHPKRDASLAVSNQANVQAAQTGWQDSLDEIQAQSGVSLPQPPDPSEVAAIQQEAQTDNITSNIGRSLLINLAAAKAQGMGNDAPTQDQILSQALSQIPKAQTKHYTQQDIVIVAPSKDSEHAYGNALMQALNAHPKANMQQTLVIVANALDTQDAAPLKALPAMKQEYQALETDLAQVPVPQTLAPLHLQILNDFADLIASVDDMQFLIDDPIRGLAGMQQYRTSTQEATRVFTNIAQAFNKDGILFNKDEAGAAWASVLSQKQ